MLKLGIKKNLSLLILPKDNTVINLFDLGHFSSSSSSSAASKTLNPPPNSNPISEFLINSCGFSSQKAASASKVISKSMSVEQADSVRHFFKRHGFTDTNIRRLFSNMPRILHADVDETLQPNLQTLHEMGFTEAELQLLAVSNPPLLVNPLAIPRLEFWKGFLGAHNREVFVRVFRRNRHLICQDTVKGIAPKIALLKEYGLSQTDIIGILRRGPSIFGLSSKTIEALLMRAKGLGLHFLSSSMFARGISSLCGNGSGEFNAKMEVFKEFGWSEEEFLGAFKKSTSIVSLSRDNIREKMEFLVGIVGCKPSYIASRPLLLTLSLEKRLMPRYCAMDILRENGIVARMSFYTIMCLPEKKFMKSIILPYKEQLPKIREAYLTVCAGQIPSDIYTCKSVLLSSHDLEYCGNISKL